VGSDANLARLQLADICLDTLSYNAHTTGTDALWAGVPIITCWGTAFAGRVGASSVTTVGLPQLVTQSMTEYQALAIKLANEPACLNLLKEKLASNRIEGLPLFDTKQFCRHLEAAYLRMWKTVTTSRALMLIRNASLSW
jgi:protein O-GlcNAc transferase